MLPSILLIPVLGSIILLLVDNQDNNIKNIEKNQLKLNNKSNRKIKT